MASRSVPEMIRLVDRIIYQTSRLAAGFTIMAMFVTVVVLVVARYVAKNPIFWGDELARYIMFYMIMLGSAVALREDRHLRLRIVMDMLPPAFARWWERILDLCVFVVAVAIFYYGLDLTLNDGIMMTPALRIKFFWVFLAFPIGAVLMLIQIVAKQFFKIDPPASNRPED